MTLRKRRSIRPPLLIALGASAAAFAVFAVAAAAFAASGGGKPSVPWPSGEGTAIQAAPPLDASPFRISGPNEERANLAGPPGLENLVPETNLAAIRQQMPDTPVLAPADLIRFKLTAAVGRKNASGFGSVTYYSDDIQRQLLSLGAWTKVGNFNLVVPLNSPVTEFRLTTVDGLPALTILPSANVAGGLGPRTVYLYQAGVIYAIHGEGFLSDDSFMSIVHNFIGEVKK